MSRGEPATEWTVSLPRVMPRSASPYWLPRVSRDQSRELVGCGSAEAARLRLLCVAQDGRFEKEWFPSRPSLHL